MTELQSEFLCEVYAAIESISKKLDELLAMKKDINLLTKKTENIEKMLIEEQIILAGAMNEHLTGRTISLAEAEKALGIDGIPDRIR